ncbi:MAG: DNA-directed RNA polymerase [Chaetfec virus UA24_244]|nr:MAG: DNA-directed RNA polymerase [Chaetfec virus UA24_244]
MPEYIEREAALNAIEKMRPDGKMYEHKNGYTTLVCADEAIDEINNIPAADIAPVVHGRWEETDWVYYDGHSECVRIPKDGYLCTACRRVIRKNKFLNSDFCPNCGARMDKRSDQRDKI